MGTTAFGILSVKYLFSYLSSSLQCVTGTTEDDLELEAVERMFGDAARGLAMSSTKSATGHLLGAAGAIEAIVCVLAMQHGLLPATINLQTPDPTCDLDYVPNAPRAAELDVVLSNSFGFGGHNVCLALRRYR